MKIKSLMKSMSEAAKYIYKVNRTALKILYDKEFVDDIFAITALY